MLTIEDLKLFDFTYMIYDLNLNHICKIIYHDYMIYSHT